MVGKLSASPTAQNQEDTAAGITGVRKAYVSARAEPAERN
jgi:hypothetical protein